jgi:hypothetical protein
MNRRDRRAQVAKERRIRRGHFTSMPPILRFSRMVAALKEGGTEEEIAVIKRLVEENRECPKHGYLEDPIVGLAGEKAAVICPHCSSPEILAAWEKEGAAWTSPKKNATG